MAITSSTSDIFLYIIGEHTDESPARRTRSAYPVLFIALAVFVPTLPVFIKTGESCPACIGVADVLTFF
jgi:hypothetical protein